MSGKKLAVKITEIIFDGAYLLTVFVCAVILLSHEEIFSGRWLFGAAAVVLCSGDAFHLIPRILAAFGTKDYSKSLGRGKLVTSLTMTLFYLILWHIGAALFDKNILLPLTAAMYTFAAARIILCLLPQNDWAKNAPSAKWSAIRNIPFFIMGALTVALFAAAHFKQGSYPFLWLAVALSFAFYLPVVIFSQKYPKVGMLMLPKSLAYIAVIIIGSVF